MSHEKKSQHLSQVRIRMSTRGGWRHPLLPELRNALTCQRWRGLQIRAGMSGLRTCRSPTEARLHGTRSQVASSIRVGTGSVYRGFGKGGRSRSRVVNRHDHLLIAVRVYGPAPDSRIVVQLFDESSVIPYVRVVLNSDPAFCIFPPNIQR